MRPYKAIEGIFKRPLKALAVKSPVQGQIGPWGEIALLALFSLKGLLKAFERLLKTL